MKSLLQLTIGLLVMFVGLGNSAQAAVPAVDDGKAALKRAYDAAKKEGAVSIWALNATDLDWIPKAFNKTYPGVKIEIYTDLNVSARVITEAAAGRNDVDVVWLSEALVQPMIDRKLLISNEWKQFGVRNEDVGAE